jgi:hypothetical protein
MYPSVPIATTPSVPDRSNVLRMPQTINLLLDHASSGFARYYLGTQCSNSVKQSLLALRDSYAGAKENNQGPSHKRAFVPEWARRAKNRFAGAPGLHLPTLAMRCYLAEVFQEEMATITREANRANGVVAKAIA